MCFTFTISIIRMQNYEKAAIWHSEISWTHVHTYSHIYLNTHADILSDEFTVIVMITFSKVTRIVCIMIPIMIIIFRYFHYTLTVNFRRCISLNLDLIFNYHNKL